MYVCWPDRMLMSIPQQFCITVKAGAYGAAGTAMAAPLLATKLYQNRITYCTC